MQLNFGDGFCFGIIFTCLIIIIIIFCSSEEKKYIVIKDSQIEKNYGH